MRKLALILLGFLLIRTVSGQQQMQPVVQQNQDQPGKQKTEQGITRSMNNLPMISEVRSVLEFATGWTLQDNGVWISAENKLPFKDAEINNSGKAYYKLGKDNFEMIEMRDVMVRNELYVVLVIRYKTGWYEFPILMEGWHKQQGLSYYVFKQTKLQEILPAKFEFNKPYIVNTEAICSGTMVDYNKDTWTSSIAYNIEKTLNDKTIASHNLLVAVLPVEAGGQRLARFRLIQVLNKKKLYLPYLDVSNREKLFRSSYWETGFDAFQTLVRYSGSAIEQFAGTAKTAEDYYKRGLSYYGSGNYPLAIADLTEASRYAPYSDFFLTYAYRANAREKAGDNIGALQDFDRAISLKPGDPSYYSAWLTTIYNRGVARYNVKDFNGACHDWHTAVQMGFKDVSTDAAIKDNCKNYQYTPSALTMTTTTSSIPGTGSSPETMNDYYKVYMQGVWKYENGNYSEALRYFNRALELKPQTNAAAVYSYRGNCKLKLSDYVGAISDLDYSAAFAAANPSDKILLKTVYYSRGLANFFLGNASVACSDFQKSINAGMSDPEPVSFINQVCK